MQRTVPMPVFSVLVGILGLFRICNLPIPHMLSSSWLESMPESHSVDSLFKLERFGSDSMDPFEAWPEVKIGVKTQDGLNSVALHDCNVNGIARRQTSAVLGDFSCP